MPAAFFKLAKRVDETRRDERIEARTFLRREAVVADVGLGVCQINLGVRDVEVAAPSDGLFLFQFF